ncbi:MAG: GDP-mannose 4,6-dehydratase [Actinomycetota bacterium]|nr:GDP-mannose 4,6-dehydratase [Actinomycetota bacterium]
MSKAVSVTGAQGFAGRHLLERLGADALPAEVDVTEPAAVVEAIREAQPRAVVHLAAQSSVAASWEDAAEAWNVNVLGTVNVLEAVRTQQPEARVLFPSTGEVYGRASELPTPESAPVAPVSPYAATKGAAELACAQFARSGGDVIVARSFNHEGPGRDERFAIGSWTRQIAQLEEAGDGVLEVGDLSAERDLTDVRDVVRAYELLLDPQVEPGTYNVASGRSVPMAEVVELLVGLARCSVEVEPRQDRMRPADIPAMRGDASKLERATGWRPEIPLEQTLSDALDYARRTLTREEKAAT